MKMVIDMEARSSNDAVIISSTTAASGHALTIRLPKAGFVMTASPSRRFTPARPVARNVRNGGNGRRECDNDWGQRKEGRKRESTGKKGGNRKEGTKSTNDWGRKGK